MMGAGDVRLVEDAKLVRRARAGHRKAFDELVSRFRGAITLIAYETLHSRAAAEDVAQEVFLVAFKSLAQLRETSKFASWLYAIARYRARRMAYHEQRFLPTDPAQLQSLSDNRVSRERTSVEGPPHAELTEALSAIKPEYRIVLLLRYSEQWPIARIAAFLSLPTTTVNWRLHQARKALKQILLLEKDDDHDGHEPSGF